MLYSIPIVGIVVAAVRLYADHQRKRAHEEVKAARQAVKREARKARREYRAEVGRRIAVIDEALEAGGLDAATRRELREARRGLEERLGRGHGVGGSDG